MSLGKPVVLSNLGGAAEQVEPGVNGYLFPPGDIDALADCLGKLNSAPLRSAMGQAAARKVRERFTEAAMISAYENVLTSLAGGAPAG